ncbi:MAG: hypothetical protein LBJ18_01220, partial [Rickettsiales bacterium]|nr:hypothetical protein [Rickettsiales bacterium]
MSLQDLVLGGIKWELAPESAKPIQEKVLSVECRVLNVSDKFKSSIQHSAVPPIPVAPHDELTSAANTAATGADSGDALCAAIREFKHPLSGFANAVMPHFGKDIRLVIITDVPTAEDDASTSIMTGACGELLDKMLGSIDLSRESVSIIPL